MSFETRTGAEATCARPSARSSDSIVGTPPVSDTKSETNSVFIGITVCRGKRISSSTGSSVTVNVSLGKTDLVDFLPLRTIELTQTSLEFLSIIFISKWNFHDQRDLWGMLRPLCELPACLQRQTILVLPDLQYGRAVVCFFRARIASFLLFLEA